MPRIPRYVSREITPPHMPALPDMGAAVARSAEVWGRVGQQIASMIIENQERDRNAEIKKNALVAGNLIRDEEFQQAGNWKDRVDYENFDDDLVAYEKRVREKLDPVIRDRRGNIDPDLALAVERSLTGSVATLRETADTKARQMFRSETLAELEISRQWHGREYMQETDPDRMQALRDGWYLEVDSVRDAGLIWPHEAVEYKAKFDYFVIKTLIDRDPEKVDEILDKYDIAPEHRLILKREAEALIKKRQQERDQNIVTDTIRFLKEPFDFLQQPYDYQKMKDQVVRTPFQKEHGLRAEHVGTILNALNQEEKSTGGQYNVIQDTFLRKLNEGALTEEEVFGSVLPATGLAQGDKAWFLNEIKRRRIAPNTDSNQEVYGRILKDVIINPGNWNKEKIWSYMGRTDDKGNLIGLSPKDTAQIWKVWEGLRSEDPQIALRWQNTTQALTRLEEYRKNYFFIDPAKEGVVTKEEALLNDMEHNLSQRKLLDAIEEGKDPFISLQETMLNFLEKKKSGFWDKIYSGAKEFFWPPPPPPPEKEAVAPTLPPPGNKEGIYEIDGITWKWSRQKGWHQ